MAPEDMLTQIQKIMGMTRAEVLAQFNKEGEDLAWFLKPENNKLFCKFVLPGEGGVQTAYIYGTHITAQCMVKFPLA